MKLTIKTIAPILLATTAISSVALASDSYAPTPSWMGYESTVSNSMPISQSFNKLDQETTQTDNSKRAYDSFNTDNSKRADDSFNKSVDLDVDASRRMDDSYNTDNSKRAYDSFNTDNSKRADDSFNTDNSINDSYNTANNQRQANIADTMSITPTLNSEKYVSSGDVQGASNAGHLSGHTQAGYQGGVDVGGIGNDAPSHGYGTGWGGADNRSFSNDQEIAVHGPNLGAISNTSTVNQGRDLVFGHNRSAVGNDFGNKQIFSAGDQAQLMKNDQFKAGDNSATATDSISTNATKSSRTKTQ